MPVIRIDRTFLLLPLLLIATACGGPAPDETLSGEAPTHNEGTSVVSLADDEGATESAAPQEPTCPIEWRDVCASHLTTCNVRCCNGYYTKTQVACGVCEPWAWGVCRNRGGVKRIRWTE